jgi:hypothetical protein
MTHLEAINSMLLYVNEMPVDSPTEDLQYVTISNAILDDTARIVSSCISGTITKETLTSYPLLENYIVKRSGRQLYSRIFGYEDKGLEVILLEEKHSLGNVIRYVYDEVFGITYSEFKNYTISTSSSLGSIEEIYKIDSIIVPTDLSVHEQTMYKIAILTLNSSSELSVAEKTRLLKSLVSLKVKALDTEYDYYKQDITNLIDYSTLESIDDSIDNIVSKIDSIRDYILDTYSASETLVNEYTLYKLTDSEINTIKLNNLLPSLLRSIYSSITIDEDVRDILLSCQTVKHKNFDIADIQSNIVTVTNIVDEARKSVLAEGWFFNRSVRTLYPDSLGYIIIPENFISVIGGDDYPNVIVRDHKLFDKETSLYKFDGSVECTVIEDVTLDDIQEVIKKYILAVADMKAYIALVGVDNDLSAKRENVAIAKAEALREESRVIDNNVFSGEYETDLLNMESL